MSNSLPREAHFSPKTVFLKVGGMLPWETGWGRVWDGVERWTGGTEVETAAAACGVVGEGRHGRHADTLNRGLWERHKSVALGCVLLAPGVVFTRVFRARTRVIYVFLFELLDKTGVLCILTSDSPSNYRRPCQGPLPSLETWSSR